MRELDLSRHYLFVIPSFTSLQLVRDAVSEAGLPLKVGAQNVHWEDGVEATGEISARMLADIPWTWLKSGHSNADKNLGKLTQTSIERHEVPACGLTALVCIGENSRQKDQGKRRGDIGNTDACRPGRHFAPSAQSDARLRTNLGNRGGRITCRSFLRSRAACGHSERSR